MCNIRACTSTHRHTQIIQKMYKRADTFSRTHTLTHSLVNLIVTKPSCTHTQFHTCTYLSHYLMRLNKFWKETRLIKSKWNIWHWKGINIGGERERKNGTINEVYSTTCVDVVNVSKYINKLMYMYCKCQWEIFKKSQTVPAITGGNIM